MPASLLCDFGENGNNNGPFGTVDQSNLDLALEFSWLNLNANNGNDQPQNNMMGLLSSSTISSNNNNSNQSSISSLANHLHQHHNSSSSMLSSLHNTNNSLLQTLNDINQDSLKSVSLINKRSQNTTECVPVPSSEHVAEIVGRQGCKIKALRAKTNTYIKTPVRGEEPVFVVTGRKEDVNSAKREILSAAEHFSQIRAQRKNNPNNSGQAPNAHLPGHVTIQVRVPYRVVGLVVGPKGATIKRIQQQTSTYIITPSREKDPVFEVTGLPDDVETARKEIEAHIAIRTGGIIDSTTGSIGTPEESSSDFSNSPLLSSFDNLFSSLGTTNTSSFTGPNQAQVNRNSSNNLLGFFNTKTYKDLSSIFQVKNSNNILKQHQQDSGKTTSNGSYDTDEGLGDSPTFDIIATGNFNSLWSSPSPNLGASPSSSESCSSFNHPFLNNINGSNTTTNPLDYRRSSSLDSTGSTLSSNLSTNNLSSSSSINSSSCVSNSAPISSAVI